MVSWSWNRSSTCSCVDTALGFPTLTRYETVKQSDISNVFPTGLRAISVVFWTNTSTVIISHDSPLWLSVCATPELLMGLRSATKLCLAGTVRSLKNTVMTSNTPAGPINGTFPWQCSNPHPQKTPRSKRSWHLCQIAIQHRAMALCYMAFLSFWACEPIAIKTEVTTESERGVYVCVCVRVWCQRSYEGVWPQWPLLGGGGSAGMR